MAERGSRDSRKKAAPPGSEAEGYFVPWATDATALLGDVVNSDREKLRRLLLVQPVGILDFEKAGVLIVAGDRGTGKSSILMKKAARMLSEGTSKTYRTLRQHPPFVNQMAAGSIAVPVKQYQRMSSHAVWEDYWLMVLKAHYATLILRQKNVPRLGETEHVLKMYFGLNREISQDPGKISAYQFFDMVWLTAKGVRESMGTSLAMLIKYGVMQEEVERWGEIAQRVIDLHMDTDVNFTIFVDAIDEAIGSPGGKSLFKYLFSGRTPEAAAGTHNVAERSLADELLADDTGVSYHRRLASQVWLHAQTGFIAAADRLYGDYFFKLATYGAVRREAGDWYKDPNNTGKISQKVESIRVSTLSYTHSQLNEIFDLNVDHTVPQDLYPGGDGSAPVSHAMKLFGFGGISHPRVLGADEPLLQLITRHTFMAPRHLVGIARAAKNAQPNPSRRPQSVGLIVSAIDKEAEVVFKDYVANVSPAWTAELNQLVCRLKMNVFMPNEAEAFEVENKCPGFFGHLYSRGLVGVNQYDSVAGHFIQYFWTPDGAEIALPQQRYLVLHPALSAYICGKMVEPKEQQAFYSGEFVVGAGLRCPEFVVEPQLCVDYLKDADRWRIKIRDEYLTLRPSGQQAAQDENSPVLDSTEVPQDVVELSHGGESHGAGTGQRPDTLAASGGGAPLGSLEDRVRAVTMIFALLAFAIKRNKRATVSPAELDNEARIFSEAGVFGGRLCKYPLPDFPRNHLYGKEGGYMKMLRGELDKHGLGIIAHSTGEYCFAWKNASTYHGWTTVDPAEIRAVLVQPCQPRLVQDEK